jgi:hypothetical protein
VKTRLAIGALGVTGMAFGVYQALAHLSGQLPALVLWLAVPVIITDALVSPAVITIAWAGRRVLPRPGWGPAVVGLVGTGALTAAASVVLTRPGAHRDLPSLLDRNYPAGYLLALATLWSGVLLLGLTRAGPRRGRT